MVIYSKTPPNQKYKFSIPTNSKIYVFLQIFRLNTKIVHAILYAIVSLSPSNESVMNYDVVIYLITYGDLTICFCGSISVVYFVFVFLQTVAVFLRKHYRNYTVFEIDN